MPSLSTIGSRIGTRMVIAAMVRGAADEQDEQVGQQQEDPPVLGQAEDEVGRVWAAWLAVSSQAKIEAAVTMNSTEAVVYDGVERAFARVRMVIER